MELENRLLAQKTMQNALQALQSSRMACKGSMRCSGIETTSGPASRKVFPRRRVGRMSYGGPSNSLSYTITTLFLFQSPQQPVAAVAAVLPAVRDAHKSVG